MMAIEMAGNTTQEEIADMIEAKAHSDFMGKLNALIAAAWAFAAVMAVSVAFVALRRSRQRSVPDTKLKEQLLG